MTQEIKTELPHLSASELGALWMTYHKKTMILRMLEYFIEKAEDNDAKRLMSGLLEQLHPKVIEMGTIFEKEGAAIPEGFKQEDVNLNAPILWENGFDIMCCRILKEISMGMYVLHLTRAYRKDVIKLYTELTALTENYYGQFTQYLLDNGLYSRPTYITMPESTDDITNKDYVQAKRTINAIEFGQQYYAIETNIVGMKLLEGFAQTTKDEKIKKYFEKGVKICKKIIGENSDTLLKNNIQPPATPGGTLTNSTDAPFSERLMMFNNYLTCGLALGAEGFGVGFNLRNDIQAKNTTHGQDIFQYQREGAKLMMSNGWLEEPPKMDL